MADSPSIPPSKSDKFTAEKTLLFLGKQLQVKQFVLKAMTKKRKWFEGQEKQTRKELEGLKARIQFELDSNPGMFRFQSRDNDSDSSPDSFGGGDSSGGI